MKLPHFMLNSPYANFRWDAIFMEISFHVNSWRIRRLYVSYLRGMKFPWKFLPNKKIVQNEISVKWGNFTQIPRDNLHVVREKFLNVFIIFVTWQQFFRTHHYFWSFSREITCKHLKPIPREILSIFTRVKIPRYFYCWPLNHFVKFGWNFHVKNVTCKQHLNGTLAL